MVTLFTSFVLYTLLMLVFAAPAMFVARRAGRPAIAKRFLIAAPICGLVCGITAAGSQRLINRCLDAGHKQCYDAGGTGIVAMVVVGMLGAIAPLGLDRGPRLRLRPRRPGAPEARGPAGRAPSNVQRPGSSTML